MGTDHIDAETIAWRMGELAEAMVGPMPARLSNSQIAFLYLLPPDGTPVLNRVMRVMLAHQFEQSIDPELYNTN